MKTISSGNKIYVGEIKNNIFTKRVKTHHLYTYTDPKTKKKIQGWYVDKGVCQKYIIPDDDPVVFLLMHNVEDNTVYQCDRKTFVINSIELPDRFLLALEYWQKGEKEALFKHVDKIEEVNE